MGMFDTVVIEGLKLPSPGKQIEAYLKANNAELPTDYQTKDLNNALDTFYIDKKGQLWLNERVATGKKIVDNWPLFPDNRSFLERLYSNIKYRNSIFSEKTPRRVTEYKTVKKKCNVTVTLNFYTFVEVAGRNLDLDYVAIVNNGKIKSIKCEKSELESVTAAAKRRKNDEEFFNRIKADSDKRKEFTAKWYYPILKETYNPFVFFTRLAIQSICNKIVTWTYKWHGV